MGNRKSYDRTKEDKEDLHGEVRRLRKQVRSLQRENDRLWKEKQNGKNVPPVVDDSEIEKEHKEAVPPRVEPRCKKCGSEITKMEVSTRTANWVYHMCKNLKCRHREKIRKD